MKPLSDREKKVLELIMNSYIASAEPVGSRTLSRMMENRWSSATVRNTMADLEDQGYLTKPHVVAGRVPTGKAFRYYVNSLLIPKPPRKRELEVLDGLFRHRYSHVEEIMEDASRVLASLCQYASIVVEPRVDTMLFKEIEFVRMSRSTILIVFVTSSGIVHTRMVSTDDDLGQETLNSMKAYMNERCENVPFFDLKHRIFEDMRRDRENFSRLLRKVVDALETITDGENDRDIYIDGTSKMIGVPEFSDVNKLKELFQAFEKKEKLIRLLDQSLREGGIHVIIGAESDVKEMRHMSFITSTYTVDGGNHGILGVIGPVRMDYSKLIPLVNYTAKTVTSLLNIM